MPKGIYKRTKLMRTGKTKRSEETKKKISLLKMGNKNNLGRIKSSETKLKISLSKTGKPATWNRGLIRSQEVKDKISKSKIGSIPWNKGKKFPQISGEKHPNWRGGVTSLNEKIRKSLEYKLWRTAVFERDNYTCIWCKEIGGNLNADHIKPFAYYPELRFAIDNGRTLCVPCHKTTETYGWKSISTNTYSRKK